MTARFASPQALDEVLRLLAADPAARPIAGGTDLVVAARQGRRPLPDSLVAIDRVPELAAAVATPDALHLGALTSHAWLAASPAVRERWTALADACAIVGSPATRGTGTLGGNLMNASPAAEATAPLVVFRAVVTLRSAAGEREVPVATLATAPGRTCAEPGELLVAVSVPAPGDGSGSAYVRLEYRQAMEIAVVGAAVLVGVMDGVVHEARIALTAVAPTIVEASDAAASLVGRPADPASYRAAATLAAEGARPIDDVRASADYRRAMVRVVVARALQAAALRAADPAAVAVPASRWAHGVAV